MYNQEKESKYFGFAFTTPNKPAKMMELKLGMRVEYDYCPLKGVIVDFSVKSREAYTNNETTEEYIKVEVDGIVMRYYNQVTGLFVVQPLMFSEVFIIPEPEYER